MNDIPSYMLILNFLHPNSPPMLLFPHSLAGFHCDLLPKCILYHLPFATGNPSIPFYIFHLVPYFVSLTGTWISVPMLFPYLPSPTEATLLAHGLRMGISSLHSANCRQHFHQLLFWSLPFTSASLFSFSPSFTLQTPIFPSDFRSGLYILPTSTGIHINHSTALQSLDLLAGPGTGDGPCLSAPQCSRAIGWAQNVLPKPSHGLKLVLGLKLEASGWVVSLSLMICVSIGESPHLSEI